MFLLEPYFRVCDIYCSNAGNSTLRLSGFKVNAASAHVLNCVASITNAGTGDGAGFIHSSGTAVFYNCIALSCKTFGFHLETITTGEDGLIISGVALGCGVGFNSASYHADRMLRTAWSCYAANNTTDFSLYWSAPSGWCASKDATANRPDATNYKTGLDLITLGKMDSYGLALSDDLYAAGGSGDNYGRNPYDDVTATSDFYNFLKNDTAGDAISKKDIKGTDRPTPDTADSAWNVGASQSSAVPSYDDGITDGGIVFGGEVVETPTIIEGLVTGGIVFGSSGDISTPENNQIDGTASGGIVFGGETTEQWSTEPNNSVAVKGGLYRISGVLYTLANTMSIEGLGSIAALVNCSAAPAVAGTYRYDLLSIDAAGDITVTAGTAATVPVMPMTPASSVKLNHVLRYYGQTSIVQSDIGKIWLAPALATIEAAIADDELAWAELSTTITITCRDQYGQLFTGNKTVSVEFLSGNGTIAPLLKSGTSSSFVFTYTRGTASPMLSFSSSTGAACIAFIMLLDAGGSIMT